MNRLAGWAAATVACVVTGALAPGVVVGSAFAGGGAVALLVAMVAVTRPGAALGVLALALLTFLVALGRAEQGLGEYGALVVVLAVVAGLAAWTLGTLVALGLRLWSLRRPGPSRP